LQADLIWKDVQAIRDQAPLVHNITNYVVMNNTANALLSIGASPVMAHAVEEVKEMVAIAAALVVNIGTLSKQWLVAMEMAMTMAAEREIPIVFDPVGAGATTYRTHSCRKLLLKTAPDIIRGNSSEIMALLDCGIKTKGVDSSYCGNQALTAADTLAKKFSCIVVVSGEVDLVTDGSRHIHIHNGHAMMTKVTGLGCTATALTGAFAAVNKNYLLAAASAMAVMGICGEIAIANSAGPATLQVNIIDAFYNLNEEQIRYYLK
jgi:hydroxyethylthiazole kinase